jgi:hypothetical protein
MESSTLIAEGALGKSCHSKKKKQPLMELNHKYHKAAYQRGGGNQISGIQSSQAVLSRNGHLKIT